MSTDANTPDAKVVEMINRLILNAKKPDNNDHLAKILIDNMTEVMHQIHVAGIRQ